RLAGRRLLVAAAELPVPEIMEQRAQRDDGPVRPGLRPGQALRQAADAPDVPPVMSGAVALHGLADDFSGSSDQRFHRDSNCEWRIANRGERPLFENREPRFVLRLGPISTRSDRREAVAAGARPPWAWEAAGRWP